MCFLRRRRQDLPACPPAPADPTLSPAERRGPPPREQSLSLALSSVAKNRAGRTRCARFRVSPARAAAQPRAGSGSATRTLKIRRGSVGAPTRRKGLLPPEKSGLRIYIRNQKCGEPEKIEEMKKKIVNTHPTRTAGSARRVDPRTS